MSDISEDIGMDRHDAYVQGVVDIELSGIEPGTLERLVCALGSLQEAQKATTDGLASDHMENAAREIRKAMRMVGA